MLVRFLLNNNIPSLLFLFILEIYDALTNKRVSSLVLFGDSYFAIVRVPGVDDLTEGSTGYLFINSLFINSLLNSFFFVFFSLFLGLGSNWSPWTW